MIYKKTQTMIGYTMLFAALVAAIIMLSTYFRNSVGGRWRDTGDVFGGGEVYDPYDGDTSVSD